MSKFIVFEGPDGSGKSTQFSQAVVYLKDFYDLYVTKEPTTEPTGKLIKEKLKKDKDPKSKPLEYLQLYVQDRAVHNQKIRQRLKEGDMVISDRYYYSTIAYQLFQGLDLNIILEANKKFLIPDLVFIIDIPTDVAFKRIYSRAQDLEKFEKYEFQKQVREHYLKMPEYCKLLDKVRWGLIQENIVIIDGNRPEKIVFEDVKRELDKIL